VFRLLIEKLVKLRNPEFNFDPAIPITHLLEILIRKLVAYLRAYRVLFHFRLPGKIFLGENVTIEGISNIHWGDWVQVGRDTVLSAYGTGKLLIGNNVTIGSCSRLVVSFSLSQAGKHIKLGDNVGIGDFTHIGGGGGVEIGNDTIIGAYFSCHPSNHIYSDAKSLIRNQGVTRLGISVGNNCWIGAKVTLLDGISIGDNCVIGAGSLVNKSIPANSVAVGVPANVIRQRASNFK
jgi:acetyltransferase-like isoleucine patch superfamily enzyme